LCFVCVVCCQVEVSATSWSLVQRSPTECVSLLCVITKPRGRGGHSPRWAAESEIEKKIGNVYEHPSFQTMKVYGMCCRCLSACARVWRKWENKWQAALWDKCCVVPPTGCCGHLRQLCSGLWIQETPTRMAQVSKFTYPRSKLQSSALKHATHYPMHLSMQQYTKCKVTMGL
jgi:hypothetical protein